jgi:GGDEF domain-containing protein
MGASLHGPGSEGANLVDASTGFASRLLFADRVDHALVRSERTDGVFSVVLVDVGGSPRPRRGRRG